jgi:uncharacterized RDD family membrane protein YckC
VAGPGARAYAFLVDWHVRTIMALAWFTVAALIFNGRLKLTPPQTNDAHWFIWVVAPALAIYFLYHYALEPLMHGRTPGKRMAGVRIAARDGGTPTAGALLTRNVFRLLDSLPVFYGVGLAATMATREHLRVGDMAAGTLLVYERADALLPPRLAQLRADRPLDAVGAELIGELLERWPTLGVEARSQLARRALARFTAPSSASAAADVAGKPSDNDAGLHAQLEALLRGPGGSK